jgi:hypothetical protein
MPVREREFRRIANAEAFLQRGSDQRHAAERSPGQAANVILVVPIDQGDRAAILETLVRGHESRDTGTDNDYVAGLTRQYVLLRLFLVGRLSKLENTD